MDMYVYLFCSHTICYLNIYWFLHHTIWYFILVLLLRLVNRILLFVSALLNVTQLHWIVSLFILPLQQ